MAAIKPALAALGLRTRSKKDTITGKRIPGSSSNKFLQVIGVENKEDAEKTIKEAEKASSKKKGLVFVFNLLLKTLEEIRKIRELGDVVDPSRWPELINQLKILKEKEDRLLYIIAYSSILTDDDTSQDMRNLLASIKTTFQLTRPDSEVTNWKNLYPSDTVVGVGSAFNNLDSKIRAVKEYIKIATGKSMTRDRRMARTVVKHKAPENIDPTLAPYEIAGNDKTVGPFFHIGSFLPDTPEHMQKTIDERERVAGEEFRKAYHKRRREDAIRRDIALGRITAEEASNFPEDYGKALNTGGKRSRKRKTRKRRKRKRTRKKRKSRRKKTKKRRRKKQ